MGNDPGKKSEALAQGAEKRPTLVLTQDILNSIIQDIGLRQAETGGALGRNGGGEIVSHFYFDETSKNGHASYSPDSKKLNSLFKESWNPEGVRLCGFVHSHPGSMRMPSRGDEIYATKILKAIDDLEALWLPIVNTVPETGEFRLTPWLVCREGDGVRVDRGKVQVAGGLIQESGDAPYQEIMLGEESLISRDSAVDEIVIRELPEAGHHAAPKAKGDSQFSEWANDSVRVGATFERVRSAYDLELMQGSRIIAIGAGGAASWLEEMARAGMGQFVLVDPDIVSETNLATQQTYRRDIGKPKVACIAERIRDINPTSKVVEFQKRLEDLSDDEIRKLSFDPLGGRESRRTVICGLTDNFEAQARVNRLALKYMLPSICAQVYAEGRGAEVTFAFPGVTPACHRCILSSRYKYYASPNNANTVTSDGTPIFSTTRLNAIKGFILLALLHHGSEHPRWGNMLLRIGKRNLVQIRMDPDIAVSLGLKGFDKVFENAGKERLFFDEVIWLPQDPECPATGYAVCPDCGGTGDLRHAAGKFEDTRSLPLWASRDEPDPDRHGESESAVGLDQNQRRLK